MVKDILSSIDSCILLIKVHSDVQFSICETVKVYECEQLCGVFYFYGVVCDFLGSEVLGWVSEAIRVDQLFDDCATLEWHCENRADHDEYYPSHD